jgi:1-pyrroline-5-carboxylate dehydrogenase
MFIPFHNEPLASFSEEAARQKMQDALALVGDKLGRTYCSVVRGERLDSDNETTSRNPANFSQVVGRIGEASVADVDRAVDVATETFKSWSRVPVEVRARYLVKAAAILRRRIHEFSAWMVFEASKSWAEAYNDTAEAVDFLEYYAREAVRICKPTRMEDWPGEDNELVYRPIGVGAIISPWNFPLAILCGMTVSAIVTGNTVVVKPAEQTPVIAYKFMQLLEQAGVPAGVVNMLLGPGETIGEAMTGHPGIRFVSFTGSKDVGLHIYQRIATPYPGQRWLKRAVLEMGGKDAIVVDEGVNLDIAALDVAQSAFGFQGQKCSACSRLIAHANIYDALVARVVDRASKLSVGDPLKHNTYMGAVIDSDAYQRILQYIAIGRNEGRLLLGGNDTELENNGGYFIRPCVIADVDRKARIAQEEIFGPVLAIIRAEDFDEALEIANDTDYGLTGGVYSYNRAHLEQARSQFEVGNLYLNRKCTGAMVGVQPFGGFKMSGTNSKAGGPDYLHHFLDGQSVAERF